jgi:site-specific DNA-methyltransferase (adenine-specific)
MAEMNIEALNADCRAALEIFPSNHFDSVVTDPPYALTSITKRFGKTSEGDDTQTSDRSRRRADGYARLAKGFMGKEWDNGDTAFTVEFWAEILRVLKPGGYVVAFGGSRTYHRLACAIEDAGFIIHPMLGWIFGQGFPKAHKVEDAAWEGWAYGAQSTKPALEPICFAQKPFSEKTGTANVLRWRTGAINIDGCRIHADDAQGGAYTVTRLKPGATLNATGGNWRPEEGGVLYHGETKPGRWPANLCHDGSAEVLAAFPNSDGQLADVSLDAPSAKTGNVYGKMNRHGEKSADMRYYDRGSTNFAALPGMRRGDSGSAARFFYCAKASKQDRAGSKHPTVKPINLIRWLARLVTPPNGLILDPFAGSGTTGAAAHLEGFRAVLVEREAEYFADIERRLAAL